MEDDPVADHMLDVVAHHGEDVGDEIGAVVRMPQGSERHRATGFSRLGRRHLELALGHIRKGLVGELGANGARHPSWRCAAPKYRSS